MGTEHVSGLSELSRRLKELPQKVAKGHLKFSVMSAARLVRDEARKLAPVDSGRLKKSIIIKFQPRKSTKESATYYVLAKRGKKYQKVQRTRTVVVGGKRQKMTTIINQDAYYWRFVEFGTARQKPQKFMRPAFEKKRKDCVALIAKVLREGIEKSARQR
jgi:HK97 gp10 family phage protein